MERIVLIAILVVAVAALVLMLRRSFRRSAESGGCAGCPMAGGCGGQADDARTDCDHPGAGDACGDGESTRDGKGGGS